MADVPLITLEEDLPDGLPKINKSIQNSNEALKKSFKAEAISTVATNTADRKSVV